MLKLPFFWFVCRAVDRIWVKWSWLLEGKEMLNAIVYEYATNDVLIKSSGQKWFLKTALLKLNKRHLTLTNYKSWIIDMSSVTQMHFPHSGPHVLNIFKYNTGKLTAFWRK